MSYNSILDAFFSDSYEWLKITLLVIFAILFEITQIIYIEPKIKQKLKQSSKNQPLEKQSIKSHEKQKTNQKLIKRVYGKQEFILDLKQKWMRWIKYPIYVLILMILSVYLFLNKPYIGYGHAQGIDDITIKNNTIYVLDYLVTGGGRTAPGIDSYYSRINVLDAITGSKIIRIPTGKHGKIVDVCGDSIFFDYNNGVHNFYVYSTLKGKLIATWNKKTLPEIYKELSVGIDEYKVDDSYPIIKISTIDGRKWHLFMQNGKLCDQSDTLKLISIAKEINSDLIEVSGVNYKNNIYALQMGKPCAVHLEGDENMYLVNGDGKRVNNHAFLCGEYLMCDNCSVILSYATTKRVSIVLTGISGDGKKILWEIKQTNIAQENEKEYPAKIPWAFDKKTNILYIPINNEIVAINVLSGNIIWKQKL